MKKAFCDWRLIYTKKLVAIEEAAKRAAIENAEAAHRLLTEMGKEMWARASGKVDGMRELALQVDELQAQLKQQRVQIEQQADFRLWRCSYSRKSRRCGSKWSSRQMNEGRGKWRAKKVGAQLQGPLRK